MNTRGGKQILQSALENLFSTQILATLHEML